MREGSAQPLKALLARYAKTLRAPQGAVVDAFLVIAHDAGIPLTKKSVSYTPSSKTLAVTLAGPKKNEILMRRGEFLSKLKVQLGEKNAPQHII